VYAADSGCPRELPKETKSILKQNKFRLKKIKFRLKKIKFRLMDAITGNKQNLRVSVDKKINIILIYPMESVYLYIRPRHKEKSTDMIQQIILKT